MGYLFGGEDACGACRDADVPADAVVAVVEEAEDVVAVFVSDAVDGCLKALEKTCVDPDFIAGLCFDGGVVFDVAGGEVAYGFLEFAKGAVGNDGVVGAGAAGDGVAPCEIVDAEEKGEDARHAAVDEDDIRKYRLCLEDKFLADAFRYFFEGIEYFGDEDAGLVAEVIEPFGELAEATSGAQSECIPSEGVLDEDVAYEFCGPTAFFFREFRFLA